MRKTSQRQNVIERIDLGLNLGDREEHVAGDVQALALALTDEAY